MQEDEKYRRSFAQHIHITINQAERDITSPTAQSLPLYLDQARDANQMLIGETEMRLIEALNPTAALPDIIALRNDMLQSSLSQTIIQERTDKMV